MAGFLTAAREAKEQGTFNYLETTILSSEISKFLEE